MIRKLAEALGRHIVIRRKLSNEYGGRAFYVSGEGGLGYLLKPSLRHVDSVLLRLAKEIIRPEYTVWDIGANLGLFTFAASGLAGAKGHVIAIEADIALVALLRRSVSSSKGALSNVTILAAAISDTLGLGTFHIARRARAANYLEGGGSSQTGGTREIHTVLTTSVDWLAKHLPLPDILKIDVEGLEGKVLCGASATICASRPLILCEVSSEAQTSVTACLRDHGYVLFDGEIASVNRPEISVASWCTLAVPREKLGRG